MMYIISVTTLALGLFVLTAGDSFASHGEGPYCALGFIEMPRNHFYCPDSRMNHTIADGAIDGYVHSHPFVYYKW